jgi:hypothetical protein
MAYIKQACNSIAQKIADDKAPPPRRASDDGDGGWLRPKEVGLFKKDPEQVRREAQHEAAFEATMAPGRLLHEAGKSTEDAVVAELLMESLGKPTTQRNKSCITTRGEGRRNKSCITTRWGARVTKRTKGTFSRN